MSTVIMRSMRAAFALALSSILAWSLLCAPVFGNMSFAHADDNVAEVPSVSGMDFMQPSAKSWDLIKVENLGKQAIYISLFEKGKRLTNPMKFTAKDSPDYIAQVVQVDMTPTANTEDGQTPSNLLDNYNSHPTYTIEVSDALMEGRTLYDGTIYPVYAKIVNSDESFEYVLLGVRTVNNENEDELTSPRNIGVGSTYYKQDEGDPEPTSYSLQLNGGVDCSFDGNAFIVTYVQNPDASIEGSINYVDINTGKIVMTETFSGISEEPKTVSIKKSFTAVEPGTNDEAKYYRTISSLGGSKVTLSLPNADQPGKASYTVNVVEVKGMDKESYTVLVKYVDENDNLLWSDTVNVKGFGYRYTLPNTFSIKTSDGSKNSEGQELTNYDKVKEFAEGVNFYHLKKVVGGKVVYDGSEDGEPSAQAESDAAGIPTYAANEGNGTALVLTKDLVTSGFVMEDDQRVVKAVYDSQDVDKEVDFTLIEMDGESGKELGRVEATVDPDNAFSYTVENKVFTDKNKTYVPWAGHPEKIEYSWEDLSDGVDLMQYVYYVPEDYVPGDGYDITIQYVNILNGDVLRTQTLPVDPEITDYVTFVGDPSFTQNGNEYVRLAGQGSGIRHAYFSPNRTYTVYYRDVNDVISANTVITNTQIINTILPGTSGGITAGPTPIAELEGDVAGAIGDDALLADAGVTPGDGTTIINDDDNPLANLEGEDTTTERIIEENENPLAAFAFGLSTPAIVGLIAGGLILIGLIGFLVMRHRKKAHEGYGM